MLWQSALAAAVFGVQAYAGIDGMATDGMLARRAPVGLEDRMAAMVEESMRSLEGSSSNEDSPLQLTKRDTINTTSMVLDSSLNVTTWETVVNTACTEALSKLSQSTNPSGTCTCYNLLALDNQTGVFEADLRLFQVSTARDQFAGIAAKDVNVSLVYADATVSAMTNLSSISARSLVARQVTLLKSFLFVGQINSNKMSTNMTMAQLEAMVTPIVTLSATSTAGLVTTNVSMNEAAFVAGVFSNEVVLSSLALAEEAVANVVAELNNGTVAFVLPGVQLILFPIGLIITSVWLVVGFVFIAFGTYERINYREQYKRQTALVGRATPNRI